jgi:hypothetical protein
MLLAGKRWAKQPAEAVTLIEKISWSGREALRSSRSAAMQRATASVTSRPLKTEPANLVALSIDQYEDAVAGKYQAV